MALNARQQRFVNEYSSGKSATQAYIAAGFSGTGAKQGASRMLTNVDVQSALSNLQHAAATSAGMTVEQHLADLKTLRDRASGLEQMSAAITAEANRGKVAGYYDMPVRVPDWTDLSDDELRQIEEGKTPPRLKIA